MDLPAVHKREVHKREVHVIRDFQIDYQDFLPLITPGRKIPSTTLNAFLATVQITVDQSSSPNLSIFSSWIAALASDGVKPGAKGGVSTIEAHIEAMYGKDSAVILLDWR
ncbi:hypothetical protein C8J56DRAFT_1036190 [Mycena floridula]|nr:hypothetical protein C8J56DRAFT_1036190 [Mycena floridula]